MISKRIFIAMLTSIVVFWEIGFSHAVDSTTLVFLTWKPNQPKVWERLIEQFQLENQDIRIKLQVGPHSSTEYHAILTQRL
ncbi:MAG: hypothetical protein SWO11_22235, partial [Thermodesulfobacteriota bacterium]|nr:hypothetical protein [Thermodesulfobacteriota bacterium]